MGFYAEFLYNMYCARSKEFESEKHNIQTQRSDEMHNDFDSAVEEVTFLMFCLCAFLEFSFEGYV